MNKYLIEVPHGETRQACERAIKVFLTSGSHFLSKADWGCLDGEHKAWIIVEVENKEQAMNIVPPLYRSSAKVIKLTTFTAKKMRESKKLHSA